MKVCEVNREREVTPNLRCIRTGGGQRRGCLSKLVLEEWIPKAAPLASVLD